jgi:hypothetical protein
VTARRVHGAILGGNLAVRKIFFMVISDVDEENLYQLKQLKRGV